MKMDKIDKINILLISLLVSFLVYAFFISDWDESTDYKTLYEELQYNQTIQDAFNNGTIFGINEAKRQIIEAGSTCEPFSISSFDVPTEQTITMELKWVECPL